MYMSFDNNIFFMFQSLYSYCYFIDLLTNDSELKFNKPIFLSNLKRTYNDIKSTRALQFWVCACTNTMNL